MKKLGFIILLGCFLLIFCSCKKKPITPPENISEYYLNIILENENREASICQTIKYTNTSSSTMGELYLHLYANNYRKEALNAAYDSVLGYYGEIEITTLQADGDDCPITYLHEATLLKVILPSPLQSGGQVLLTLDYKLHFPFAPLRFGKFDRTINMGNFYPIMAVYENGEWRLDGYSRIGDPFYSEVSNYKVDLTLSRSFTVASSGNIVSEEFNNQLKTIKLSQENVRDFALVLSKDYQIKSKNVGDTVVNYFYYLDATPQESLDTAASALECFSNLFGPYPYPTYNIAESAFFHGGMEYPALVIINASLKDKREVIIHETAHQWFSCLIGSDSIREAYIDEGLATFCTLLYYKLHGEHELYNEQLKFYRNAYVGFTMVERALHPDYVPKMTKTLYEYKSLYEYEIICYSKSTIMFATLYDTIGEQAFIKGLNRYYTNYCYKLSTLDDLAKEMGGKKFDCKRFLLPFIEGDAVIAMIAV